ncbi:MAG: DUF805 domain-containing protein [Elusimicrobiaceae bacterium]|jgi:uncharacterized membrane protein YhaH (DUF805 family)|nr:DUF805 domain-containing protein [Elusimicrobiaceae bacterium]MBT3955484.1 DUF805 domain-containing protein [Elusimicrobiaceae bacterium]MBT4008559.1 DUF805 domain-containing protein [Elusimicrobiaceae bacterium]MBT4402368.1 DUF805 domain-containing protein [Elusimicrobiaceae bacterium]MBT4440134.1 DUF805 domain-containing protein [Elusimicrobiaceae bacterium]
MKYFIECITKKFATFKGRTARKDYWMFILIHTIITISLRLIDVSVFGDELTRGFGTISLVYSLFIIIPLLSATVRRLHDTDRSAGWILINLIPFGSLILLIFLIPRGTEGENRFG